MARRDRVEEKLAKLETLRGDPDVAERDALLIDALQSGTGLLAAKAVQIIQENRLSGMNKALAACLAKLLKADYKSDPGCDVKCSIVEALSESDAREEDLYIQGLKHIQMEPVWGKSEDTAGRLRGLCLYELARWRHPDAPYELVDLLDDNQPEAREAVAEAAKLLHGIEAELVLRQKILQGDEEPRVLLKCFEVLADIAPEASIDFFARFLDSDDPVLFECAAIGIAESHRPESFALLRDAWDRHIAQTARADLLTAMAIIRTDEAFDFMLTVIRDDRPRTSAAAVKALAIWKGFAEKETQIQKAVEERGEQTILETYRRTMGKDEG